MAQVVVESAGVAFDRHEDLFAFLSGQRDDPRAVGTCHGEPVPRGVGNRPASSGICRSSMGTPSNSIAAERCHGGIPRRLVTPKTTDVVLSVAAPSRRSGRPPQKSKVMPRHEAVRGASDPAPRPFRTCHDVGDFPAAAAARDAPADQDDLGPPPLGSPLFCPCVRRRMGAVAERILGRAYVTTTQHRQSRGGPEASVAFESAHSVPPRHVMPTVR